MECTTNPPEGTMIFGAHSIIYSQNADADRACLRDILGFESVDAGRGWLIFALPPGEVAVHPAEDESHHELYLMCDDVNAEIARLKKQGIACSEVSAQPWGKLTNITLPSGGQLGLYEPHHPMAIKR